MNLYKIRNSIGKDVGSICPQANSSESYINRRDIDFLDANWNKKINIGSVKFASLILRKSAKKTDLISVSYLGYSCVLLISDKLILIFEKYQNDNLQFFPTDITYKGKIDNGYWVARSYRVDYDFVDYPKSSIEKQNIIGPEKEVIKIKDAADFIKKRTHSGESGKIWGYTINKLALIQNVQSDLFVLDGVPGGIGYYVSEKLKQEIEDVGCTGVVFEKSDELYLN